MLLAELKSDFSKKSTSTANKFKTDAEVYRHIHVPVGQNIVMLVGAADGLQRHLDAAVQMGLKDLSKLWLVDYDDAVIKGLKTHFETLRDRYQGEPHFVASDLLAMLKAWDKSNGKIYFVDFDGTKPASKYHIAVYEQCMALDVEYVSMVGSARGATDPGLKELAAKMGYDKVERRHYVDKEEQLRTRGKYTDGYTLKGWHEPSGPEILQQYLTQDSGQESVLKMRNYQGANEGDKPGAQMFVYLFKVH